ncbi:hypothetical protein [Agrobacterium pusense]|nr:hypothetical protein [Agrobacterium pusense]
MIVTTLRRFLFLFAVLGLLFAPASVVMATAAMTPGTDAQMNMKMDSKADMPSCANEQPVKELDCGKPCPLALICSTSLVGSFGSTAEWKSVVEMHDLKFSLPGEDDVRSTISEPPARPPKI